MTHGAASQHEALRLESRVHVFINKEIKNHTKKKNNLKNQCYKHKG